MRERYTTTTAWLRHEQPIVNVEETCELGTRLITLPLNHVIQSAANRHLDRIGTLALRWGSKHYPRLTYHGKS